jgi:HORMA domain
MAPPSQQVAAQAQAQKTATNINVSTSTKLIQNTLRASVSSITHARRIFPSKCFEVTKWAGQDVSAMAALMPVIAHVDCRSACTLCSRSRRAALLQFPQRVCNNATCGASWLPTLLRAASR